MLDIETLATTPDGTILTIAAQRFDLFATGLDNDFLNNHYYARITLESQENRVIDDNTIAWWATQPEASAEAFAEEDRVPLDQALRELGKLCWQSSTIWAQGPHFDITILENAYKQHDITIPWQFYKIRDCRSVISLWPDCPKPETAHHALTDCRVQIDRLQQTIKHLGIKAIR